MDTTITVTIPERLATFVKGLEVDEESEEVLNEPYSNDLTDTIWFGFICVVVNELDGDGYYLTTIGKQLWMEGRSNPTK